MNEIEWSSIFSRTHAVFAIENRKESQDGRHEKQNRCPFLGRADPFHVEDEKYEHSCNWNPNWKHISCENAVGNNMWDQKGLQK